jgi:hypothetical protein
VFDTPCTGGPLPSLQHSHNPQASSAHAQLQSRCESRCGGKGRTLPPTLAAVGARRAASRLAPESRAAARRRRGPGASSTRGVSGRCRRRRRQWRQGTGGWGAWRACSLALRSGESGWEEELGLGFEACCRLYTMAMRSEPLIKNGQPKIVGLIGLQWAFYPLRFYFSFFILSHHYERTHKNNYHIYTNTFFIYNILHISHHVGVSRISKKICYFLPYKWISACLPKVIWKWPIGTSNMIQKIVKNRIRHL